MRSAKAPARTPSSPSAARAARRVAKLGLFCLLPGLLVLGACPLRDAVFGRSCMVNGDCPTEYRCFSGACVPSAFPDDRVDAGPGPPGSDACADATVIALGVPVQGNTSDAFDDGQAPCAGDGAAERYYAVDLPTATALVARLTPSGYDGALYALSGCGALDLLPDTCTDDPTDNYAVETLILPSAGPGRVIFAVDGATPALVPVVGSYSFVVEELDDCPVDSQPVEGGCVGVTGTATMTQGRTNLSATLLPDGRVLVVGGRGGSDMATTRSAELFDPDDDSFTATGSMANDRARHVAVLLEDGRVWVAGGVSGSDGDYSAVDSAEIWDPDSGTFTDAPALPSPRDLFSATLLPGGNVLVVGGRDGTTALGDAWLFSPGGGFTEVPGGLQVARYGHTATLIAGDVLVCGGRFGEDSLTVDESERYGFLAGSFVSAGSAQSRGGHTATLLADNRVLIAGGFERQTAASTVALADTDLYDALDDSWDFGPTLSQPRLFAAAAHLGDHGVLLLGGDLDTPLGTVELFSPIDDSWQRLPALLTPRLALSAVALPDGRVLVLGGDGGTGSELALDSAELYGFLP